MRKLYTMEVGKRFPSFVKLKQFISNYEKKNLVQLYISDCGKLSSAKRSSSKIIHAKKELVYFKIQYSCIHGGKKFKSQSTNQRKTSTFRKDCPFKIRLALSFNGQNLEVTSFTGEHNHSVNKEVFKAPPKQKVLSEQKQTEIIQYYLDLKDLDLDLDQKLVKQNVGRTLNKKDTQKDLQSIKIKKSTNMFTEEELLSTVQFLKTVDSAIVEILVDGNDFEGLYFQTDQMRRAFADYPEIILLDTTYCFNNSSMLLYIMMVINGNGEGEVACTFLVSRENASNIEKMLKIFTTYNLKFTEVLTVFADKKNKERAAIRAQIPTASILLCLFHTLRTFKRTFDKMALRCDEKNLILKIILKLVYSKNKEEYDTHYQTLLSCNLADKEKLISYFNTYWHCICDEWVVGLMKQNYTMNIVTSNHLENLNQKIKQVFIKNSPLLVFYIELIEVFFSIHNESKIKANQMVAKRNIKYIKGSLEEKYANYLTPFAASFVLQALERSKTVNISDNSTEISCDCVTFTNIGLPCCHIFFKRNQNNEDMFCEIAPKFTKAFHIKHYVDNDSDEYTSQNNNNHVPKERESNDTKNHQHIETCTKILSKNEKHRKAFDVCQDICSALADYGSRDFNKALEKLQLIRNAIMSRHFLLLESGIESKHVNVDLDLECGDEHVVTENLLVGSNLNIECEDDYVEAVTENSLPAYNVKRNSYSGTDHTYNKQVSLNTSNVNILKRKGRPRGINSTVLGLKKKLKK